MKDEGDTLFDLSVVAPTDAELRSRLQVVREYWREKDQGYIKWQHWRVGSVSITSKPASSGAGGRIYRIQHGNTYMLKGNLYDAKKYALEWAIKIEKQKLNEDR